ncbi:hypothetical protein K469DRAFT_120042 [Zopfia rhizophila CBS 207.26]|uniref:F-box domain-containing protein n=1 Tax=Zopfia rhizophila CBS 207.26 TaxID=1314779 RepID=A0A6A6E6Z7_9PEZI|nr:hypothetical protein K469DRAFT_120042 [Zopfia rhizophila CBS 207.26]
MTGLEDLNEDILFLVLQYLEAERSIFLRRLRLVSWRLKDFAESQMFKRITVGDEEDLIDSTNRFIERLLDPNDKLSRHVRDFTVASFEGNDASSCLNSSLFVKLMDGFQGLDSFSWNVDTPIPRDILDAFQIRWPHTHLCVRTARFDKVLFSFPQLYQLDISVPCKERHSVNTLSLFRKLKEILVQSSSLRVLSLNIHRDPYIHRLGLAEVDRGSLNLPLDPGDQLPPLEELTIEARDYDMNTEYCGRWFECMDWKKLCRLKFKSWCPHEFFMFFTNKIPNVESLQFGYFRGRSRGISIFAGEAQGLNVAGTFIISVNSLRELIIQAQGTNFYESPWDVIAQKHGDSMRRLTIACHDSDLLMESTMDMKGLEMLSSYFPFLQNLDLVLSLTRDYKSGGYAWPAGTITALGQLNFLKSLKISARLQMEGDRPLMVCILPYSRGLVIELWNAFFEHDPTSELITVIVRFWRWEDSGPLPFEEHSTVRMRTNEVVYVGSKPNGELKVTIHGDLGNLK